MFHKRASKSAALLFFNMVIVLVSALLVLVNIRARSELEESRRGFYSRNAVELSSGGSWEEALEILLGDDWKDGILFKDGLELEADTRGVFYKGDFKKLPLASGRYFTEEEVSGTEKKAMIGQRFERDTYEKDGKQYLEILEEPFEVVGVLGSAQPTRLDSMKWIPMAVAVELTGPEGTYKLDGKSERAIEKNADLLRPALQEQPATQWGISGDSAGYTGGFREQNSHVVEKIYLSVAFSFILTMVLAGGYWARGRTQKIQVEKMLGFSGWKILLSVLGGYFRIAMLALAAAGTLVGILILGRALTAVSWKEFCLVAGGVLLAELAVVAAGLVPRISSRKIAMKRG